LPGATDPGPIELAPDPCPGRCTWERTIGLPGDDKVFGAVEMADGGFVVVGNSRAPMGGEYDAWVMRLDAAGRLRWRRDFGGPGADQLFGIAEAADGTLWAAGHSRGRGAGESDGWVLQLSPAGDVLSDRVFGGVENDRLRTVTAVGGGVVAAGFSASGPGGRDAWVLRFEGGALAWERRLGGPRSDQVFAAAGDGAEVILAGQVNSGGEAGMDLWVFRLDDAGETVWELRRDRVRFEAATAIVREGAGFAIAGSTGVPGTLTDDLWVLHVTGAGAVTGEAVLGGAGRDTPWGIAVGEDGVRVAAVSWSRAPRAGGDAWLVALDAAGQALWERHFGGAMWDRPTGLLTLRDGGLLMYGHTSSSGAGYEDGWLLRLDAEGRL
ncbi:MAG: hypothetical protein AAFW69_11490, partial [Pseudomonadota bacterium]